MRKLGFFAAVVLCAITFVTPAQAIPVTYFVDFSGAAEAPPNASPGTGFATVTLDLDLHTMTIHAEFANLLSPVTVAHIHCCTALPGAGTAGVATMTPSFAEFPAGATAGTYDRVFDLLSPASWNAAFITNNGGTAASAEAAFAAGVEAGRAYFNIHTQMFPGGEIRGFLVSEPGSLALMAFALAAGAATMRRRMRR
jgi:hypothetical protein